MVQECSQIFPVRSVQNWIVSVMGEGEGKKAEEGKSGIGSGREGR